MGKLSRQTGIGAKSRAAVNERDNLRCVYCGRVGQAVELAHLVGRAQGGLGIPQNLISLCLECHRAYDGTARSEMGPYLENFLRAAYPGWDKADTACRKE